jgi:hypothetical protein
MSGTTVGGEGQLKVEALSLTSNHGPPQWTWSPYAALKEVAQRLAINRTLLPLSAMTCLSNGELRPHGGPYCHRLSG